MKQMKLTINLTKILKPELNIFVFLLLSIVAGMLLSPNFLDFGFLLSSTTLYAELGLIAIAFTFLMISGEIDLSVASNMTLVACIVASLYQSGINMALLIPLGLIIGFCLGLFNGILVTTTKLPSLLITIGTMSLYKGLAQVLIGDQAVTNFPSWFIGIDKKMIFGFIPIPLALLIVVGIIMELILKNTFFGRKIVAMGLNRHAAKYSAVKVDKIKILLFGVVGFFCAVAGILSVSRLQVATYAIGTGGEMDVITMVLLGGTAFSGGSGRVLGTVLAFFILVFIRVGMRLAILSDYVQIAVIGALLIIVIIISHKLDKYSKEHS
jgi:rhamnose transport system permease protein